MSLRIRVTFVLSIVIVVALAVACVLIGAYYIPVADVIAAVMNDNVTVNSTIINDIRIPMMLTAALSGAALSVSGLLMQTTFINPLAGPSVLGVSTGSSLGVAVILLAGVTAVNSSAILLGAIFGAFLVIAILIAFSSFVRSSTMLLIVGIMIGYLISSAVSLLNFFATQEGVHSFVIWGLGNFSGVSNDVMPIFATACVVFILLAWMMSKPLDALLLGDRYATSLGVNVRRARTLLLAIAGILVAVVTAWCGPIAFIGMTVPHIARMTTATAEHRTLLPATAVIGAAVGLLSLLISVLPGEWGMIPINAVTPIIGVPVILYVIVNRRRLNYFN